VESELRADLEQTDAIDRLVGALANLGHAAAPSTIAAILLRNGVEPAPERSRKTSWKEFLTQTLRSHRGGGFLYH
jgi:hypothetical protein